MRRLNTPAASSELSSVVTAVLALLAVVFAPFSALASTGAVTVTLPSVHVTSERVQMYFPLVHAGCAVDHPDSLPVGVFALVLPSIVVRRYCSTMPETPTPSTPLWSSKAADHAVADEPFSSCKDSPRTYTYFTSLGPASLTCPRRPRQK